MNQIRRLINQSMRPERIGVCSNSDRLRRSVLAAAVTTALLITAGLATSLSILALHNSSSAGLKQQLAESPQHAAALPILVEPTSASLTQDGLSEQRLPLVSHLSQLDGAVSMATRSTNRGLQKARFHPSTFLPESQVLNYTVYCDPPSDSQLKIFYSEPTWLCRNVRVGKRRLPFTDTTTRNQDDLFLLRKLELDLAGPGLPNEMCGRLPERGNNIFLLCEMLLTALQQLHNGQTRGATAQKASSVHVPYGNCSLPEHGRAILVGNTVDSAVWHREDKLWPGFIVDIFCSFPLS